MKPLQLFAILILLSDSIFSQNEDTEDRQLWLLTATISRSYTMHRDTIMSFSAGNMTMDKEKNASVKITANGQVTAIIENFAENPLKDFSYNNEMADPISLTVTGQGSKNESSNYTETINGKLVTANTRNDNMSGSARPSAGISFDFSADDEYFGIGIGIKAVGSYQGRGFDGSKWNDFGGDYDNYGIDCSGGCNPKTDKNCTMVKTAKGFQCSWKIIENKQHHTCDGTSYISEEIILNVSLSPYKESEKPQVILSGCTELGVGENSKIVASAKPEGGTFRFWAEPGSMLTVESVGPSADITGASPENGSFFVEYTTFDGKKTQTSQTASCVSIESYNGGAAIPQIALYDIDGKKLPGIKTVAVDAQPANVSDLIKFEPDNPGVLSAVGVGNEVTLQGIAVGKTMLQAKTKCDDNIGPAVEVEVVNCDDETIATLERMMQAAKEGQKGAYEAIERIVGTKEFEELDRKIAESTENLAVKTAGLIIGTLAGGTTAGAGVKTAAGIYGKASNVMDILKGGDALSQVSNLSQLIVELGGSAMQQAIAGSIETLQAANEFGQDLGKMIGSNQELQSAMKEAEHWNKVIEDIVNRQKFCRNSQSAPQSNQEPAANAEPPATEPEPASTEPTVQTQQPQVQEPAQPGENPPAEPPTSEPTPGEGTEISPPSPTSQPRQVGLPYSPTECGCNKVSTLEVTQQGFSNLQTGMENLGKCVDTFSKGPLTNYIQTLQEWQTVLTSLSEATKAKPADFKLVSEQSIPIMETLLQQTKTFDTEGKAFVDEFGSCPKSLEAGVGMMQSAEKITIESISTNY